MLPLNPPLTSGALAAFMNPSRPYDESAYAAFDEAPEDPARQVAFARHVLELDPENIWAMMVVARDAPTQVEGVALLREGVRVGLRLWAPALEGSQAAPDWGRDEDTIPFVGCVLAYGMALKESGHSSEAAECLRFLLMLDPRDEMGATAAMEGVGVYEDDGGPANALGAQGM